jgi:hypothetical protein
MGHWVFAILFYAALLGVTAFAWVKGSLAERAGATINLAAAGLVILVHASLGGDTRPLALLAVDGLLAVGFLILALRYASLWVGAALVFQAMQFGLHATYLVRHLAFDITYARVNNIDSLGILLSLAAGVAAAGRPAPASRA